MSNEKVTQAVQMMIQTNKMHKSLICSRVKECGIQRTQHKILMSLALCEKMPSQKEIADKLDITPAAVTIALKSIEENGYIKRTLGHDSRYNEIEITEKGREMVALSKEMFLDADLSSFEGFSDEELDFYMSCLEKIQTNIRNRLECDLSVERK